MGLFGGIKRRLIAYIVETYIKHKLKRIFNMKEVIKFLKNKKAYIVAGIFVVLNALQFFNVINLTPEVLKTVDLILGGLFGLTMRAAIKKVQEELGIQNGKK